MTPSSMSVLVMTSLSSHTSRSLPRQSDVDSDDDEPESRLVKVDKSNGFDVDDWSLPNCLARCVSGRDRSLTGLLERGLENG